MKKYNSEIMLLTKTDHYDELVCWLEWHLKVVKVDHIVLFDNESTVDISDVVSKFGEDKIEYYKVKGWPNQYNLYNNHLMKSESNWVIALDDDEYLYIGKKYNNDVNTFLSEDNVNIHNKYYILWVNMFSKDYLEKRKGLYIENNIYYSYDACKNVLTEFSEDNSLGKCFINTFHRYKYSFGINRSLGHIPLCLDFDNKTFLESGEEVKKEHVTTVNEINENCFIAHYQYKDNEDWFIKCSRPYAMKKQKRLKSESNVYRKIFEFKDSFKKCNLVKSLWTKHKKETNV